MGRGRGKGKRGGRGGGGRRQYVTSLEDMEARNVREEAWNARKKDDGEEEDDEEGEEESSEEEEEEEKDNTKGMSLLEIAEKGEAKVPKPKGVEGLIEVANPNAKQAHLKNVKIKDMDANAAPVELSRREREALEAERKKAHYLKLHAEGKTDEAKADMERLAAVRKRREEAAKRKKEEEEQAAQGNSRGGGGDSGSQADASGPEKLNPLEVKKMNPAKLKELLKERDQSLQGSKKDLITRLLDWEKARHG